MAPNGSKNATKMVPKTIQKSNKNVIDFCVAFGPQNEAQKVPGGVLDLGVRLPPLTTPSQK